MDDVLIWLLKEIYKAVKIGYSLALVELCLKHRDKEP